MEKNELILLGRIIKIHGYEGYVVIALEEEISEELDKLELVFIIVDGLPVPFFISDIRDQGSKSIQVSFDGYRSKEKVAEFVGCEIMVPDTGLKEYEDSSLPLFLAGFTLLNSEGEKLGKIIKIASFPMQIMLVIEAPRNKELLIPLNSEWIISVDKKKKILIMTLPDGLSSLN